MILKIVLLYFDDLIKTEEFNLDHILIGEKSYGNILVYNIACKNLIVNLCVLNSVK